MVVKRFKDIAQPKRTIRNGWNQCVMDTRFPHLHTTKQYLPMNEWTLIQSIPIYNYTNHECEGITTYLYTYLLSFILHSSLIFLISSD